jgi:hypothetical protein
MLSEFLGALVIWTGLFALAMGSIPAAFFTWQRPRLLRFLADATLLYPVMVLGSLYGQWLLSWYILGHKPIYMTDDPKYISGANWMYWVTAIALSGIMPITCAALACNTAHVCRHRSSAAQVSIRVFTFVGLWLGLLVTIVRDPHGIMAWWLD